MTTCSGNHFIFAFYIGADKLIHKDIHEKDESFGDNYSTRYIETACIVNKVLKILDTGFSHTIMDSQSFKDVNGVSVFCIDNIIVQYNQTLLKEVNDRDKNDLFVIDVFNAYMKYTLNAIINGHENRTEDTPLSHSL
ncbi:hypothetical protein BDB01DRAFT_811362, partial [Pilobolus umbonatus]